MSQLQEAIHASTAKALNTQIDSAAATAADLIDAKAAAAINDVRNSAEVEALRKKLLAELSEAIDAAVRRAAQTNTQSTNAFDRVADSKALQQPSARRSKKSKVTQVIVFDGGSPSDSLGSAVSGNASAHISGVARAGGGAVRSGFSAAGDARTTLSTSAMSGSQSPPFSPLSESLSSVSMGALPAYEDIVPLAERLARANDADARAKALDGLLEFTPGDLLSCPQWHTVRDALAQSLNEGDGEGDGKHAAHAANAARALRLLVDLFAASAGSAQTGEIYLSLVTHLLQLFGRDRRAAFAVRHSLSWGSGIFVSKRSAEQSAAPASGADEKRPAATAAAAVAGEESARIASCLRKFRLLNDWQHKLPTIWVYYQDDLLKSVISHTVELLGLQLSDASAEFHQHSCAARFFARAHLRCWADPHASAPGRRCTF